MPEGNKAARDFSYLECFRFIFGDGGYSGMLGLGMTVAKILSETWNGSRKGIGILNDGVALCRYIPLFKLYGENAARYYMMRIPRSSQSILDLQTAAIFFVVLSSVFY